MLLIVGIDPGKTIGIACIDLKGKLVHSGHYPNETMETVIGEIKRVGVPIIVAGDRANPSELVRKINASFGAHLFSPKREFSMDLKRRMGRSATLTNQHECDAYSAAVSAYNHYSNKFHQIDHIGGIEERELENIKRQIVTKHSVHEAQTGKRANRR
jgi:predicted RNase H-like nuclease (RuvC/YqgF family)